MVFSNNLVRALFSDTLNINIENKTLAISSTKNRSSSRGVYEKNEHIFGWLVKKLLKTFFLTIDINLPA